MATDNAIQFAEVTINALWIKSYSSMRVRFQRLWFLKVQPEFWVATCLVWGKMRLTLAFSFCCCKHCLKIGSASMYYFYATWVYYFYASRVYYTLLPWYSLSGSCLSKHMHFTTWIMCSHLWHFTHCCNFGKRLHRPQNALAIRLKHIDQTSPATHMGRYSFHVPWQTTWSDCDTDTAHPLSHIFNLCFSSNTIPIKMH